MIETRIKNRNMILTEKQQECQHYCPEKSDKYKYLTGKEILPSDQSRIIEQAKFTHSPLTNSFQIQIKTIEDQGEKQIKVLDVNGKQLVRFNDEKN